MPSLGRTLGTAATGAQAGFSVGGPAGAAVGGGIGFIAGLASDDPAELRQRQLDRYRAKLKGDRQLELTEAIRRIAQRSRGMQSVAGASGARRALSLGRTSDVESFAQPAIAQIASETSQLTEQAVADINRRYNQAEQDLELGELNAPSEPSDAEYFNTVAGGIGDFANAYRMGKAYETMANAEMGGVNIAAGRGSATDIMAPVVQGPPPASYQFPGYDPNRQRNDIMNTLRLRRGY